jgi:nucleoside-diphosphate-sugar epimerase
LVAGGLDRDVETHGYNTKVGKKQKILVIGAGDIGRRVIALTRAKHEITAATSTPAHRAPLKHLGASAVPADLDRPGSLKRLPRDWGLLLHCAPPPARGRRDTRTRNLLRAQAARSLSRAPHPTRVVVYLSTSGVYGDCGGARITESRPLDPQNARAVRRADAERVLIRHAKRGAFRLAILRVPGIYSAGRLPLARLAAGTPTLAADEDVYTNHIHAADLAAIAVAAYIRGKQRARPRVRVYHASDDSELKMGAYFDLVADAFGLAHPPRLPRSAIAAVVPGALLSFMGESRRLDNGRMKRELRIRLQAPTVAAGIAQLVSRAEEEALGASGVALPNLSSTRA